MCKPVVAGRQILANVEKIQNAMDAAGIENAGSWSTEGHNVMRTFRGDYTIAEIEAVMGDMLRVQAELDKAAGGK